MTENTDLINEIKLYETGLTPEGGSNVQSSQPQDNKDKSISDIS